MTRSFWAPVLLFIAVVAALDAAVLVYAQSSNDQERGAATARIREGVTSHLWRHVRAVEGLAPDLSGASEIETRERAERLTRMFPALVGIAACGKTGETRVAVDLKGAPPGAGTPPVGSAAFQAALSGSPAIADTYPSRTGETLVSIWVPSAEGAVAGIFRLDRMIGDAVDGAAGDEAAFVLADEKGRRPSARGEESVSMLSMPLTLQGASWTLRVQDPGAGRRSGGWLGALAVLSIALVVAFSLIQRRACRDEMILVEQRLLLEELAGVELRERGRLLTLLDSLDESVVLAGPDGGVVTSNAAGDHLLGESPHFLTADGKALPEKDLPVRRAIGTAARVAVEEMYLEKNGQKLPLAVIAAPLFGPKKEIIGALAVYRDISKQRAWEETVRQRDFALTVKNKLQTEMHEAKSEEEILRRLNYHLEAVLQPASTNVFLRKPGSERLRAERTTGLKPEVGFEAPVLQNEAMCPVLETGEHQDPRACTERVQPCLGKIAPGSFMCAPLMIGGKVDGMIHLELTEDAPEPWKLDLAQEMVRLTGAAVQARRYVDMVSQAAIRDPLTGLYNRRHFDETGRVMMAQARRHHTALGVLMIDIDHFKHFNDRYGHDAGDVVLREFAMTLGATARSSDVMVRYGGEEFAVLLPATSLAQARIAADRVLDATRKIRLPIAGLELGQVTVSIGVAAFPEHADSVEGVVKAADLALYAAKHGGRNCAKVAGETKEPTAPAAIG